MSRLNRVVVAAVMAIGVMLVGSAVGAKPQPAPGRVCTKAGRVISVPVPLVCKQTPKNGLRWRKAPTTTTTSTSTSTSIAVVAPSVSLSPALIMGGTFPKAVVVTSNVAGMVYFAEGAFPINKLSDITSADVNRWASGVVYAGVATSVPIDVTALLNGYYRVFVANNQGLLSAPATNIVTISVTRASTVAVTTTTVALTCATGGTCALGDTGPGGGVVFYVSASNFTSTGSTCNTACKYLEASPASAEIRLTWATNTNSNQTLAVPSPGATALGIGVGMANTNAIQAQAGNIAATSAAVYAYEYTNNSKADWFLPSRDELNQMCNYAWNLAVSNTTTTCTPPGGAATIRTGFSTLGNWSSSEFGATNVWGQVFNNGDQFNSGGVKSNTHAVRPVRAF